MGPMGPMGLRSPRTREPENPVTFRIFAPYSSFQAMRLRTLSTATVTGVGTIRGGAFPAARRAHACLIAWLLKSGRVPQRAY